MQYDQLPPAMRKRVDAALAAQGEKPPGRQRKSRKKTAGVKSPGRCSCGEALPSFKAYEKHREENPGRGHGRWSMDLPGVAA